MVNLTFVRSFVALAETGSFRAAAARLDLAQPTVSQHLRKLEETLGAPLIERGHAQSRPTRQGRIALLIARQMLANADRLREALSEEALVIGASGNIAGYYLPRALRRLAEDGAVAGRAVPGWRVVQAPNPGLVAQLTAGEIDLAATEWPVHQSGIVTMPWRTEEMVVILPPDHGLANAPEIPAAAFLDLPLIGGESGSGTATLLREVFGPAASGLRTVSTLGSTEAVKSAVREGLGASIVLAGSVRTEASLGLLAVKRIAGRRLAKTFHLSHAAGLLASARPVQVARSFREEQGSVASALEK